MRVISHDTILGLCELLHIQLPPLVASGGRGAAASLSICATAQATVRSEGRWWRNA